MASDGPLPFEVSFDRLETGIDEYVKRVFTALESDFLIMPRGVGFVVFDSFIEGYRAIHDATEGFKRMDGDRLFQAVRRVPMGLVVLRAVLGLSPPEWSDVATLTTGVRIGQGFARTLDRAIRKDPEAEIGHTPLQEERIRALVQAAYPALLYERFLGRPFASHRDSVSDIVGGALEDKIERQLVASGIPFFRTKRAEALSEWEQNPDVFCPSPKTPIAVIEAKMTQDDGTARHKAARVLRLAEIRNSRERKGQLGFDVIACIAGRGFSVRKSDMKSLLLATRGLVFTLSQIEQLSTHTRLRQYTMA